ncbi:MAG: hypothetical protein K8R45_03740 [Desulfobacterales bacterium]|nr:hypothetical protein [Desulfobacterales bacterium]
MFSSILYKEWLKIRRYLIIAFLLNLAVFSYLFISLRHLFVIEHAEMIWYQAFEIGTLHYTLIKYLSIITGIIIGAAQFIPEMIRHRFKLSLHLPVRPNALALWSVLIGLFAVAFISILDAFSIYAIISIYFPHEAAISALLTAIPWLWAGLVAYLGIALTAFEPQSSRKFVYLLITGGFLWLFYQSNDYESYNRAIWRLVALSLLFIPSVILPAYRYRNRSS